MQKSIYLSYTCGHSTRYLFLHVRLNVFIIKIDRPGPLIKQKWKKPPVQCLRDSLLSFTFHIILLGTNFTALKSNFFSLKSPNSSQMLNGVPTVSCFKLKCCSYKRQKKKKKEEKKRCSCEVREHWGQSFRVQVLFPLSACLAVCFWGKPLASSGCRALELWGGFFEETASLRPFHLFLQERLKST